MKTKNKPISYTNGRILTEANSFTDKRWRGRKRIKTVDEIQTISKEDSLRLLRHNNLPIFDRYIKYGTDIQNLLITFYISGRNFYQITKIIEEYQSDLKRSYEGIARRIQKCMKNYGFMEGYPKNDNFRENWCDLTQWKNLSVRKNEEVNKYELNWIKNRLLSEGWNPIERPGIRQGFVHWPGLSWEVLAVELGRPVKETRRLFSHFLDERIKPLI